MKRSSGFFERANINAMKHGGKTVIVFDGDKEIVFASAKKCDRHYKLPDCTTSNAIKAGKPIKDTLVAKWAKDLPKKDRPKPSSKMEVSK